MFVLGQAAKKTPLFKTQYLCREESKPKAKWIVHECLLNN